MCIRDSSKAIQEAAFKLGFRWGSGDKYVQNTELKSLFFWASERIYIPSVEVFEGNDGCEIWFYNGEFHDKPKDEIDLDVSGQLDRLLEGNKAKEKLIQLGYSLHQGEWLSKEEIEKQERLEAAYDLYCAWNIHKESRFCFNVWKEEVEFTGKWLRVVDKTGYRKGEL